jgi:hypothetical protein
MMQVTGAAFQVQAKPVAKFADPASHTPVSKICYASNCRASSANSMVDPAPLARGLTQQGHNRDEGEFLEVFELSLPDAIEWIRQGKINESKTIVGLFWLEKYLKGWK